MSWAPATVALVAAVVAALSVGATAPAPHPAHLRPAQGAGVAAELLTLEDQWAAGVVTRDRAVFERLLAPGFVYTEDDRLISRAALINDVSTGSDRVASARNEGLVVHQFGETAAVTGWLTLVGRGPGGPFKRKYRFTDTWVRTSARWQLVAAQDYLLPTRKK